MVYGLTQGDSSGIGPELILDAYRNKRFGRPVVVFGDSAVIEFYNDHLQYGVAISRIASPADYHPGSLNVIDHGIVQWDQVSIGKLNRKSGLAAREYVVSATRAALSGKIAAIITAPMNKEAAQLSDPGFVGHTELIGSLCGVNDVTIMLVSDQLIVSHVTTHMSLANAIVHVRKDRICTIIRLTAEAVTRMRPNARIAVAGLNPHAGENGLFGDEEIREIRPAVEWAQAQGLPVDGPFPPDTLFYMAVKKKKFDAIVCMYHDQGHVPLKLLDFEGGVNVALGLPIIRTSVDHGTAFDIAGTGKASSESLVRAFDLAVSLAETRP
jgi:4-phospho-D-threonate 3-dehydrogenase / 4-phospho-D-erythronate 3-dehydrogenase